MSDRIHLLNNSLPPRQKKNVASQNATLGEVNDALMAERRENEKMVKWYMAQVPEKVATMVAEILAANGITMKGPEQPEDPISIFEHEDGTPFTPSETLAILGDEEPA